MKHKNIPESSHGLHELGLAEAARAIRNGEVSSEAFVSTLLERARAHADLNSFITIDATSVLEAARQADRLRQEGKQAPLPGVPLGVKDSYMTAGLNTTFGTSATRTFKPPNDSEVVSLLKDAGAIVFGKNNLVEMSYGLTGFNEHYGQVMNPYNQAHVTGGSSSGAGASVAGRLVPAALGGDTVGSIRVPASLCGVVGFKPTPGRWSGKGVAPIAHTLDTTGLLARSVDDCDLVDALVTRRPARNLDSSADLKNLTFAYAHQYVADADPEVESLFREVLRKLKDAGAMLVEVDLGSDFHELAARATWSIFLRETMPAVSEFLRDNEVPYSFEQIYEGLGEPLKTIWTQAVLPSGAGFISDDTYDSALHKDRQELQRRFTTIAFSQAQALIFPTTPCAAPLIANQWQFQVAGKDVPDLFLSRNTHPSSTAGIPGISLPMGLNAKRLPLGIELDAAAGQDSDLLALARRVEMVIGHIPKPASF